MIFQNRNPYGSSRIDLVAQELLDLAQTSPRDFLLVDPYSIGDVYHTLSLVSAFRNRHCTPDQKVHLICNKRCMPVAELFRNVERCVGIDCGPYEFHFEVFADRYPLAPGFPIILEPDMYSRGWLSRLLGAGRITPLEARKLILELDLDTPLGAPRWDDNARQKAQAQAREQGLTPNSVLIFNHGQTTGPIDPEIFRVLVPHFGENIFYDALKDGNGAVPWAKPLTIPLAQVPFYAELAGSVVAVRSGIVDLISTTPIHLTTLYPNSSMINKVLPDPFGVAQAARRYTLKNLGLRTELPEHIIFVEEKDTNEDIARKLAASLNESKKAVETK